MDKRSVTKRDEARPEIDDRTASLLRAEARMREINIDDKMNPIDLLYFPLHKVPPGWTYTWVRRSTEGVPDLHHERLQLNRGWSPVPADRHPEEARTHLNQHDVQTNNNVIERRGLILCEMPTQGYQKYKSQREKHEKEMMDSLKSALGEMPFDPMVPTGVVQNVDDMTPNSQGRTFGY